MSVLAPPEPYVTKQALAEHLSVSVRWIEYQMADGLPFYRFGTNVRFKISEAEAWLENFAAS